MKVEEDGDNIVITISKEEYYLKGAQRANEAAVKQAEEAQELMRMMELASPTTYPSAPTVTYPSTTDVIYTTDSTTMKIENLYSNSTGAKATFTLS